MAQRDWLVNTLAVLALLALGTAVSGVNKGWAFTSSNAQEKHPWGPPLEMRLDIGWWNSTTTLESTGAIPAEFAATGKGQRVIGTATAVILGLAVLVASHQLFVACAEAAHCLPSLRTSHRVRYTLAVAIGTASLVLTVVLYLVLMFSAHNKIHDLTGQGKWPRPDWASICGLLGSVCLITAATQLAPAGYAEVHEGYLPI